MRTAKNLQKLGKDSAGGTYFLDYDQVVYAQSDNKKFELMEIEDYH